MKNVPSVKGWMYVTFGRINPLVTFLTNQSVKMQQMNNINNNLQVFWVGMIAKIRKL